MVIFANRFVDLIFSWMDYKRFFSEMVALATSKGGRAGRKWVSEEPGARSEDSWLCGPNLWEQGRPEQLACTAPLFLYWSLMNISCIIRKEAVNKLSLWCILEKVQIIIHPLQILVLYSPKLSSNLCDYDRDRSKCTVLFFNEHILIIIIILNTWCS